jgi:UMF1 family MFS transporter
MASLVGPDHHRHDWRSRSRKTRSSLLSRSTPGDGGLFASAAERTYLAIALSLGLFTGPVQSPSRTLLVRLAPPEKLTQFFGFYALTGKATAFAAPAAVAAATMISNSQRIGMSVILVFLIVGLWVLRKVPDLRS